MRPFNLAPDKPFQPIMVIHKSRAILCESCGNLTESTNHHCIACGSSNIVSLAKLLEPKK